MRHPCVGVLGAHSLARVCHLCKHQPRHGVGGWGFANWTIRPLHLRLWQRRLQQSGRKAHNFCIIAVDKKVSMSWLLALSLIEAAIALCVFSSDCEHGVWGGIDSSLYDGGLHWRNMPKENKHLWQQGSKKTQGVYFFSMRCCIFQ